MTAQMWTCPECGRRFASHNQTHTCAPLQSFDDQFAGKPPHIREIVERVIELTGRNGPFEVLPEQTRIALHARMSFAALQPRRGWVDGHVVLARRREDPRFRRIESFSPRNHLHGFRLERWRRSTTRSRTGSPRPTPSECSVTSRARSDAPGISCFALVALGFVIAPER